MSFFMSKTEQLLFVFELFDMTPNRVSRAACVQTARRRPRSAAPLETVLSSWCLLPSLDFSTLLEAG